MFNSSKRNTQHLLRFRQLGARGRHPQRRRSVLVVLLLLMLWSICLGLGLAQATEPSSRIKLAQTASPEVSKVNSVGTVDEVPDRYKAGQALYLKTCATCHIGLPPAVMPTQTWQQLLQDPQHYGAQLQPLVNPNLRLVWDYVRTYSRPLLNDEEIPYRVYQSRYFKVLHPKVKLPVRAGLASCISCHPGAGAYDFRSLSAEWQNAP